MVKLGLVVYHWLQRWCDGFDSEMTCSFWPELKFVFSRCNPRFVFLFSVTSTCCCWFVTSCHLHRLTHAFWWARLQTRGKCCLSLTLLNQQSSLVLILLWCPPPVSCWCSLSRTRPSLWSRVWRTRSPNTPACLCWLQLRAPCALLWSSQVGTHSLLLRNAAAMRLLILNFNHNWN